MAQPLVRLIAQFHRDEPLRSGDEVSIAIEDRSDHGEVVLIAAVCLCKPNMSQIHVSEHGKFRVGCSGFVILRLDTDGNAVLLLLGEDGIFNVAPGYLGGRFSVQRRVISAPRLDGEFVFRHQRDFQRMEVTVVFNILRNEREIIICGRRPGHLAQSRGEIVVIAKGVPAGIVGEILERRRIEGFEP